MIRNLYLFYENPNGDIEPFKTDLIDNELSQIFEHYKVNCCDKGHLHFKNSLNNDEFNVFLNELKQINYNLFYAVRRYGNIFKI